MLTCATFGVNSAMQHDHHCIIAFDEQEWRIFQCAPGWLGVRRYDGELWLYTAIDIRSVDFDVYGSAAVAMDYERTT